MSTTIPDTDLVLHHDEKEHVFRVLDGRRVIGGTHYVPFVVDGVKQRVFFHTALEEAYGGRGIAGHLVGYAIASTEAEAIEVVATCPYVEAWLARHPEHRSGEVLPEHVDAARAAKGA